MNFDNKDAACIGTITRPAGPRGVNQRFSAACFYEVQTLGEGAVAPHDSRLPVKKIIWRGGSCTFVRMELAEGTSLFWRHQIRQRYTGGGTGLAFAEQKRACVRVERGKSRYQRCRKWVGPSEDLSTPVKI